MRNLIALIGVIGWTTHVGAQTLESISEKDFLNDMPIVLSVSRLPQRLDETPGAVTVLDRDMIRLSGARDVADLLRLVPGFQSGTSFERIAPTASYHGGFSTYSNRLQVLVDGRSTYSPYFTGSVEPGLQTVALQDIERIEVLRGSNSAAYGARAMLGVINIVTRHTSDTVGLQASLAAGENNIRDSQARIGWATQDASFRITADRRADDGLAGSNGRNHIDRANFRADWRTSASDDVQLRAGSSTLYAGKGFAKDVGNALRDTTYGTHYAQLDWHRSLSEDADLALNLSHSQEAYEDSFPYSFVAYKKLAASYPNAPKFIAFKNLVASLADNIDIDGGGRATNDTLSVQHTFRQGKTLRVVWGGEFRRETATSKGLYNADAALVTEFTRLFTNAEWRLAPALVLNAGVMAENSPVVGDSVAPRVMLNWHLTPAHTLRAGVSRAYRPPSTFEQSGNIQLSSNGQLLRITTLALGNMTPERVLAREVGYLGDFAQLGLNLDVRIFQEQMGDFAKHVKYSLPADKSLLSVPAWDYVNGEGFLIQGAEYQLKWQPWRGAQFILNQAYINNNAKNQNIALAAPRLASSLSYFQKLPGGLDFSLMHQDSGTMNLQGDNGALVAMNRTDLRLALPLRVGANRGELALVIQNMGSPNPDFVPGFAFNQRAFVTLRIEN